MRDWFLALYNSSVHDLRRCNARIILRHMHMIIVRAEVKPDRLDDFIELATFNATNRARSLATCDSTSCGRSRLRLASHSTRSTATRMR